MSDGRHEAGEEECWEWRWSAARRSNVSLYRCGGCDSSRCVDRVDVYSAALVLFFSDTSSYASRASSSDPMHPALVLLPSASNGEETT